MDHDQFIIHNFIYLVIRDRLDRLRHLRRHDLPERLQLSPVVDIGVQIENAFIIGQVSLVLSHDDPRHDLGSTLVAVEVKRPVNFGAADPQIAAYLAGIQARHAKSKKSTRWLLAPRVTVTYFDSGTLTRNTSYSLLNFSNGVCKRKRLLRGLIGFSLTL